MCYGAIKKLHIKNLVLRATTCHDHLRGKNTSVVFYKTGCSSSLSHIDHIPPKYGQIETYSFS